MVSMGLVALEGVGPLGRARVPLGERIDGDWAVRDCADVQVVVA